MRIASWALVACAVLAALGLFFPAFVVRGPAPLARRASLSLEQAASNRATARRLLAVYRASKGQRVGQALIAVIVPHSHGAVGDALGDARDAMATLGGISDDDAKLYGTLFATLVWIFFALQLLVAALIFLQAVSGVYRRGRLAATLVLAIVSAAMAAALYLGCKEVVFEANDEVSLRVLTLGSGAAMIAAGATGVLICAIALVILARRAAAQR